MNARSKDECCLDALAGQLEAFGADPRRWAERKGGLTPSPTRDDLAALIATAPEARRLVDEAAALDRLLDIAAEPRASSAGRSQRDLTDRIVSAALAKPVSPVAAPRLSIVATSPTRPVVKLGLGPGASPAPARFEAVSRQRKVAALMAACLLAGIFLGGGVRLDPLLQDVADAVGLTADFEATHTAFADEAADEGAL